MTVRAHTRMLRLPFLLFLLYPPPLSLMMSQPSAGELLCAAAPSHAMQLGVPDIKFPNNLLVVQL